MFLRLFKDKKLKHTEKAHPLATHSKMKTKEPDSVLAREQGVFAPHAHESTELTKAGMKGVAKRVVAVRRADQFRQESDKSECRRQ